MRQPLKACAHRGCGQLTATRHCPAHQREGFYVSPQRATRQRLYNDRKWRNYSRKFLIANPTCITCGAPATITDHIQAHRGDLYLFWASENHQPLCFTCHQRKSQRER